MLVSVSRISKGFGPSVVLADVSLVVNERDRLALVGANGAGKTTLLRILAGLEQPDGGGVYRAPTLRIGYLDQEQEEFDAGRTVFEAYCTGLLGTIGDRDALRAELFRHGFFRRDDVDKRVGQLSVGQRRKLQIARLVALRANALLLDEPTNHVDLPTLEAFETALVEFPGPVLAVSHDRWFIERMVANGADVWELVEGKVSSFCAEQLFSFAISNKG